MACAGGSAYGQSFAPTASYPVGSNPHAVALGDFNGDGRPDVVTANNGSGNVSVLLNDGNGTLRPAVNYAASRNTKAVAVSDFNRDGALDVAAANSNFADAVNETVSVLLGNGDGTFRPKADYRIGPLANSIAGGDLNGDGIIDLITAGSGHTISALLGRGDGTFQSFVNFEVGQSAASVVVGDFNGDGKQDAAVANEALNSSPIVAVLLGKADGIFQSAVSHPVGPGGPTAITSGDFNGDGKIDLATGSTRSDTVSLLLGVGDGTFQPTRNFTAAGGALSLAASDADGDGKLDLLFANQGDFRLLRGNGDGTFTPPKTYSTLVNGAYAIAAGDLSGDGKADVVTTSGSGGSIDVRINQGGALSIGGVVLNVGTGAPLAGVTVGLGGGSAPVSIPTAADGSYTFPALAAGVNYVVTPARANYTFSPPSHSFLSLSADQRADFTATQNTYTVGGRVRDSSGAGVAGVTVALGGAAAATTTTAADGSYSFAPVPGGENYTVTPSLAGRVFNPASRSLNNLSADARFADFTASLQTFTISGTVRDSETGFGLQEARLILSGTVSQTATVSSTSGEYSFGVLPPGGSYTVTASQTDRAFSNFILLPPLRQSFANLTSSQTANFVGKRLSYTVGLNPRGVAAADFNGDGRPDLVVATITGNSVRVMLGNGDGSFRPAVSYFVGGNPFSVAAADFDGDGHQDIAAAASTSNEVGVLLGNGDGTFRSRVGYETGASPAFVQAGDLSGDGRPDLVVAYGTSIGVLVNNGNGTFRPRVNYVVGNLTNLVTLGDFNRDGKLDVIGGHQVFLGNGDGTLSPVNSSSNYVVSAAADFNGDGILDVATIPGGRTVTALGNGDGTFRDVGTVFLDANPTFIRAGEFNGDGKIDLLTVGGSQISLLLGNGDGTFQNRSGYFFSSPQQLAVADFNNDGRSDFAITLPDTSTDEGRAHVMLNQIRTGLQFRVSRFTANEGDGRATIEVTRSGDLQSESSVTYQTLDSTLAIFPCSDTSIRRGEAVARCDYALTIDTLTFAPGETTKTFAIPLVDDAHPEPPETFQVFLHSAAGGTLSNMVAATITIEDNDAAPGPNPISASPFFVRQQYLDFLSREPESDGLAAWLRVLNNCPDVNNDPGCDRVTVSSSFFRSHEFQLKGFFVYRFYAVTFNRRPRYDEIVRDMRSITGATAEEVHRKRAAFAERWTQDPLFGAVFNSMANSTYVNFLMNRYNLQSVATPDPQTPDGEAKVTLTRADLIARLDSSALTRAQVLRAVVESDEVAAAEFNRAFVAMQYFGYLRRDPETQGYNNWLNYLNANPGDFRTMVNGFVNSQEYKLRFGQP